MSSNARGSDDLLDVLARPRMRGALVKPPKSVVVGPHPYRIVMIPDGILEGAGATGTCTPSQGIIAIDASQTPTQQGDAACHEVGHAWFDMVKLDDEVEEALCRVVGPMLFAFIRENPKFIDWVRSL